jgi:hypothetical protein
MFSAISRFFAQSTSVNGSTTELHSSLISFTTSPSAAKLFPAFSRQKRIYFPRKASRMGLSQRNSSQITNVAQIQNDNKSSSNRSSPAASVRPLLMDFDPLRLPQLPSGISRKEEVNSTTSTTPRTAIPTSIPMLNFTCASLHCTSRTIALGWMN